MKLFKFFTTSQDKSSVLHELRSSRLVLSVTAMILVVALTWAYFAKIDEVTRAPGTVISSSRTQIIQSQDGGTLEALYVKEGDVVEMGKILATIDQTRVQASFLETRAKAAGLAATSARLRAEVFGGNPSFTKETEDYPDFRANQLELFKKRQSSMNEELGALKSMKKLVEEELAMNIPLVASGDVSRTEILRLQRQVADIQSQITNKNNKYFQDSQAELNKSEEELAAVTQMMAQRKNLLDQTELRSPMRGIVKNVRITTQGGVIRASEEVMQIVPLEDDLLVEAKVPPSQIAFIRLGMPANIKIDAYDYTIYGALPGTLVFISADTLSENLQQGEQPYYRARIRANSKNLNVTGKGAIEISPGMTASVEIKTGRRTVLNYIIKPVIKTINESLGER
jgi:membrane fusion protein, adhesin transport system